jgi:hypothetical protein
MELFDLAQGLGPCDSSVVFGGTRRRLQRHEGNGAGDGERLRERSKALKGRTP